MLLTNLVNSILRDQWTTFALALGGIGLAILLAFLRPRFALIALVPNALPVLLVTGLMGWVGLRINMGAAMIAAVSMGLSVDSSIHYLLVLAGPGGRQDRVGRPGRSATIGGAGHGLLDARADRRLQRTGFQRVRAHDLLRRARLPDHAGRSVGQSAHPAALAAAVRAGAAARRDPPAADVRRSPLGLLLGQRSANRSPPNLVNLRGILLDDISWVSQIGGCHLLFPLVYHVRNVRASS